MKRIMVSVATCALVLSGCSLNEVLDAPDAQLNDGAIRFGVNTPVTRAANLWDNSNFAKDAKTFNVVGITAPGGAEYLGTFAAPRLVEYKNNEWTYNNKLYWPASNLNFFTWHMPDGAEGALNENAKPSASEGGMKFANYRVNSEVKDQPDFLVGAGEYAKEEFSTIRLKHALTKVLFKAEVVAGSQLKVKIDAVEICNLKDKGDLTVKPKEGVDNIGDPVMSWNNPAVSGDASSINKQYKIAAKASSSQEFISLTASNVGGDNKIASLYDGSAANGEILSSMLLMPQYFDAWQPLTKKIADKNGELLANVLDESNSAAYADGAFIRLKCNIMALDTEGKDLEELYKGATSGSTKWLYIPVSSAEKIYGAWEANRAITYVITFGDAGSGSGGGGWTGDDGDGDGNVDPVLVPINFRVEVSDWDKYDVILQSVNFKKEGVTNATIQGELDNIATMLLTEAANNPQKKYAAKFDFTYGEAIAAKTFTMLNKFENNDKFLGGSTIAIKVAAINWDGKTLTFPIIEGWTLDKTTLTADGTVTYTKSLIAQVETHRLNALKHKAMMEINGISAATTNATTTWTYSDLAFPAMKTQGNYAVLYFTDLVADKGITVNLGTNASDFVIAAGSTIEAAVTAAATAITTSIEATNTNKYLVIYRKAATAPAP